MLCLIVKESSQLLIGEMVADDDEDLDYITLKNITIVNLVQNKEGVLVPVPVDYPHPYLYTLLTIKKNENFINNEFEFNKDKIHYFTEDDMNADIIGWYKSVQANKSGIQLATEMPTKSNIIL